MDRPRDIRPKDRVHLTPGYLNVLAGTRTKSPTMVRGGTKEMRIDAESPNFELRKRGRELVRGNVVGYVIYLSLLPSFLRVYGPISSRSFGP